jgi:hypothetical protein
MQIPRFQKAIVVLTRNDLRDKHTLIKMYYVRDSNNKLLTLSCDKSIAEDYIRSVIDKHNLDPHYTNVQGYWKTPTTYVIEGRWLHSPIAASTYMAHYTLKQTLK